MFEEIYRWWKLLLFVGLIDGGDGVGVCLKGGGLVVDEKKLRLRRLENLLHWIHVFILYKLILKKRYVNPFLSQPPFFFFLQI